MIVHRLQGFCVFNRKLSYSVLTSLLETFLNFIKLTKGEIKLMENSFYPHGKLCICSVQKKEEGFEDYRYTAFLAANSIGFEAIRNPEVAGITQEEFELCLRTEYPVFIFLVGNVQSEIVNKEFKIALENCLPILIFIKKYNGIISKRSQKIIKQLSEVSYNYDCTTFTTCEDLYKHVRARLKTYIQNKREICPRLQKGVSFAYRTNTELMEKSKRQIVIYQRTSILLLGPRKGVNYETAFYKKLTEWLTKNKNDNIHFIHVFNWEETLLQRKINSDNYNLKTAKNNIIEIYNQYQSNNIIDHLNIRYSQISNIVPYVITDTNLIFIIPIEDERFSIELPSHLMKEQEICKILDEITQKTTIIDLNKIMEFYE